MEDKRQLHRDIKPVNILIQGENPDTVVAKLGDLGLCREINPDGPSSVTNWGTEYYNAPERIRKIDGLTKNFSFPADVWSLGICIYMLLAGNDKRPFSL
jgi:serine/threonine protein kinase